MAEDRDDDTARHEDRGVGVEYDDDEPQRLQRPNSAFLGRMLNGFGRTNARQVDVNSSKAAELAIGASSVAAIRPVMQRAAKKGPAALRAACLTAAERQKLTLCTALLEEVAATFGFQLAVTGPLRQERSMTEVSGGLAALDADAAHDESDIAQPDPSRAANNGAKPLQRLDVGLQLARLSNGGGEGTMQALLGSTAAAEKTAQTARVLTRIAPHPNPHVILQRVVPVRMRVDLGSRLSANALLSLGLRARVRPNPVSKSVQQAAEPQPLDNGLSSAADPIATSSAAPLAVQDPASTDTELRHPTTDSEPAPSSQASQTLAGAGRNSRAIVFGLTSQSPDEHPTPSLTPTPLRPNSTEPVPVTTSSAQPAIDGQAGSRPSPVQSTPTPPAFLKPQGPQAAPASAHVQSKVKPKQDVGNEAPNSEAVTQSTAAVSAALRNPPASATSTPAKPQSKPSTSRARSLGSTPPSILASTNVDKAAEAAGDVAEDSGSAAAAAASSAAAQPAGSAGPTPARVGKGPPRMRMGNSLFGAAMKNIQVQQVKSDRDPT